MSTEQPSTPLVIGLTGPLGSGVSTTAQALGSIGFQRLSLSDPIKQHFIDKHTLKSIDEIKGLPDWRAKLQDVGNEGRQLAEDYWIERLLNTNALSHEYIAIDSIRNYKEAESLRKRFDRFFLVAVVASKEARWERVKSAYRSDQARFEADDKRDSDEDLQHGQQVETCVLEADYILLNEESRSSSSAWITNIKSKIEKDLELMRGIAARPPSEEEVQMATAFSQSYSSRCLKRQVGAVIVDSSGLPISLGFNENPVHMKPCIHEYGGCFKDQDMEGKLEKMEVFCPKCGSSNSRLITPWKCSNQNCQSNLKSLLFPSRNMELCTAIHAEERAIRSLHGRSAEGCTMFVTTFPCFQCSRYIVDAKIKRIVYVEAYPVKEAINFLKTNGVIIQPFSGFKSRSFYNIFKPTR